MPSLSDDEEEDSKGEGKESGCFDLLDKVKEYCTSQSLEEDFQDFARNHSRLFRDVANNGHWASADSVEHKLEFTEVYEEFLNLFERRISDFIVKDQGGTVEDFHYQCITALQTLDDYSPRRYFIEILMSTMDYDRFFFLMVGEAKKNKSDQEH